MVNLLAEKAEDRRIDIFQVLVSSTVLRGILSLRNRHQDRKLGELGRLSELHFDRKLLGSPGAETIRAGPENHGRRKLH